ncbi:MAG TPA: FAD-dependent oxidoreductase [Solirubrobacteraceae bacterium]|nr:FAD-dependent oxidoreductase [Solirubrobacteraceae bacterium]
MRRLVIVGAGLAGHRAAQAARRAGFAGELMVVGSEVHRPYDRPPLSKQLLAGTIEHEDTFYEYEHLDAEWVLGQAAVGLDPAGHVVALADGSEIEYDALVLATGRRAREWPDLPDLDGFFMLRDLDHTAALRQVVAPDRHVVIVGSGFIGCEVAATLRGLGVTDVHLIDIAPYPMPVLGPEVGARAIALHERHGVHLHLSSGVEAFHGADGRVTTVALNGGEQITADLVLLALGSVPNTEWLEGSGLELVGGAVKVDEYCLAAEGVAAAGDIALYPHPGSPGEPICIEHWSNARDMGAVAARNLIVAPQERERFVAVPTFWSDQYDVKIKSVGLLKLADRYEVVEEDVEKPRLVVEAYHRDELIGAIVFNKNRAIIDYTRRLQAELLV